MDTFISNLPSVEVNLLAAWVGVALGFISGMLLGMGFHNVAWLGGYGSPQRRMYRLGHISFFGLAIINFMLWLTVTVGPLPDVNCGWASLLFLIGATTMPLCCALMAHWPAARHFFVVPVGALLGGVSIVLTNLMILL